MTGMIYHSIQSFHMKLKNCALCYLATRPGSEAAPYLRSATTIAGLRASTALARGLTLIDVVISLLMNSYISHQYQSSLAYELP